MKFATIILKDQRKINLELYDEIAPISVNNFVKLAKEGFYKGTIFHRVINNFMIQGGGYYIEDMYIKDKDADNIKGEFSANGVKNDLLHEPGVISMARAQNPNSASSQFFICSVKCPHLDGNYAAFGKVKDQESLDVVLSISKVRTMSLGQMFNDFPCELVEIEDVIVND